jgi:hypothetical protein
MESARSMPPSAARPRGEREEPAVGGVDVQPEALFPGDLGDGGQVVDGPGVGRAG